MKNLYDGTTVASPYEAPSAFAVVHAHQKPTQPPADLICEPGLLPDSMQYAVLVSAHRKVNCLRDDPMQCKCTTSEPGTFRHPWGPVPATQTLGPLDVGNGPGGPSASKEMLFLLLTSSSDQGSWSQSFVVVGGVLCILRHGLTM